MEIQAPVRGMTCASCVNSVERALNTTKGVHKASVNFADNSVIIDFDEETVSPETLEKQVEDAGYSLILPEKAKNLSEQDQNELASLKRDVVGSVVLSAIVVLLAMVLGDKIPFNRWIQFGLTFIVISVFGRRFFVQGFKRIRHLQTNMDTLVAMSTGVAFLFSAFNVVYPNFLLNQGLEPYVYFESAAVIISFILLGRFLEERAKGKARSSLRELMNIQPDVVTINRFGTLKEVPLSEVGSGDQVVVKPGNRIPVDGVVFSGESYVNESMLTGESEPVLKIKGKKVYAGTLNTSGQFELIAHQVGAETRLSSIIDRVRKAQGSKAPVQKTVDKISSIFVPSVIAIAFLTAFLWLLIGGSSAFTMAINAMVSVLIIACPCALGLATPTAIMVGLGVSAKEGILIQNAEVIDHASSLSDLILDKTGTLTEGKLSVKEINWFIDNESVRQVLHAMENRSTHPLAKAVSDSLSYLDDKIELVSVKEISGKGITATHKGIRYFAGSRKWVLSNTATTDSELDQHDYSEVVFASEKVLLAHIRIEDKIRANAKSVISRIVKDGVRVHLLSGDREPVVRPLAEHLGIHKMHSECSPEFKGEYVQELRDKGKTVGMIGDGINDAEALARADVSIAIGSGTDTAMDVAQVTLVHSKLDDVPKVIELSRSIMKVIYQNLAWAFGYNVLAIPLAAGILYPINGLTLNPMIAGAAMAFSSVSVVLNSLRLFRWKGR